MFAPIGKAGVLCLALTVAAASAQADSQEAQRIVSVGGAVTEIVFALGEQDRLVARDTTSNFPLAATELPDVGYIRRLSPEGVISVNPDLILAEEGAGPPESIDILSEADIELVEIPDGFTRTAVLEKIHAVAAALGVPEKGNVLAGDVETALDEALAKVDDQHKRKVLFILSAQGGRVMASGTNTAADGIIKLAGGENAVSSFEGYKPMTDEAILSSGAEVILMMDRRGDHAAANEQLFSHPAISLLPAAQSRSVVRMDGMLLLGFSVRTAEAVARLADELASVELTQ